MIFPAILEHDGDMTFLVVPGHSKGERRKRNAASNLWPGGIIPYEISDFYNGTWEPAQCFWQLVIASTFLFHSHSTREESDPYGYEAMGKHNLHSLPSQRILRQKWHLHTIWLKVWLY